MSFRFDGAFGTSVRPPSKPTAFDWARDETIPGAKDGTILTATVLNQIVANLRRVCTDNGVSLTEASDDLLSAAVAAAAEAAAEGIEAELAEAIALRAPLASPVFSGTPAVPTAALGTNTTQAASTAFVQAAVAALIASAPGVLDTLDELAAALGDDANFAATVTAALAGKAAISANLSDLANKQAAFDALSVRGGDVASAATVNLDAATGSLVDVTGTTAITAITLADGRTRWVRFTGALTLTHGASLVLPGAANIVTAAGDFAMFRGYPGGVVRCAAYQRASGAALVAAFVAATAAQAAAGTDTSTFITPARLHEARVDVASAATTDLGAAASTFLRITGTTTIANFGTAPAGVWRDVVFEQALTLTNSAALLLPGAGNITTLANDRMRCRSLGSGNWIVMDYCRADGTAVAGAGTFATPSEVNGVHTTGSITSGTTSLTVASATGIVVGMLVVGEGITPGTTVASIVSTTVTLSANAGATLSSKPVSFYRADRNLSPGGVAGQLCRAWVNFNGTGTIAIRAAYNVSSITDNGTGDYTVNFTSALPDANYCVVFGYRTPANNNTDMTPMISNSANPTASALRLHVNDMSLASATDIDHVHVAIFR
jgi:hypothetical protein